MYRLLLAFILIINTHSLAAQSASEDLSQILNNLFTLQADFEQTVSTNDGAELEKSSGRVLIARPGHFLWEITKPGNIQIIAAYDDNNDYVLWYYDRDLQQASVQLFEQTVERTPAMLLSGAISNLDELYSISEENSGNNTIYTLIPKAGDSSLNRIDIIANNRQQVTEIRLRDTANNDTRIVFNNMKVIDKSSFKPNFEESTNIVDHR